MIGIDRSEQNAIITRLLYERELEEEYEWRKKKENRSDVKLLDCMLSEINKFGYAYETKTDLLQQYIFDENVLKIILDYLGKFNDQGISARLAFVMGHKSNKVVTKKIIDTFNSANLSRKHLAGFYDNAIARLKDKRYIEDYLKWLADPSKALLLPFTMWTLARWGDLRAKQLFMQHLDAGANEELTFICIKALSFYKDEESVCKIAAMTENENEKVSKYARAILDRLNKKPGKE